MQITEIYIKNFGKFSDTRFELSDKIHVFYGENEYGKSTIYAFIKAMLFGLERGRGRAALNDNFSRYEPWENPNYYAGTMRFTSGGKHFFLERHFDRYGKSARLICEDDGEELSVEDGDLLMFLDGMTEESFENTAATSHLSAKPGLGLADELKNCAANFYVSGSSEVNLANAMGQLKKRIKDTERQIRKVQGEQNEKIQNCESQISYVKNEIDMLQRNLNEKQAELERYRRQIAMSRKAASSEETGSRKHFSLVSGTLAVLGIVGILFWRLFELPFPAVLLSVLMIVSAIVLIWTGHMRNLGTDEENEDSRDTQDTDRTRLQKLQWECERLQEECREKQVQKKNLEDHLGELREDIPSLRELQKLRQALEMAQEKLVEASEQMKGSFGQYLNQEASKIFESITDGKYKKLQIAENLDIAVFGENRWIPANRLSRGTQEQIYFSLRMAALNILYEEQIPVIFDDAFVFYDEKRMKSTLKWLWEQSRQVIIFSCRRREKELVDMLERARFTQSF